MQQQHNSPINFLIGESLSDIKARAFDVYDEIIVNFLSDLSADLFKSEPIKGYPDVAAFAFWCRRSNLRSLQRQYESTLLRIGRGLAFHITPNNVPVNFAFSLVFSLLAGNVNVVRVSDKDYPQVRLIVSAIKALLQSPSYASLKSRIFIVQFPKSGDYTAYFSSLADLRLIWGGDLTIQSLRQVSTPSRCVDVCFPDRYSLSIISASAIISASTNTLSRLYQDFYNDVFLFDQNACSSPHLILWKDSVKELSIAQSIFWDGFLHFLQRIHNPGMLDAIERYSALCRNSVQSHGLKLASSIYDTIYRVTYSDFPSNPESFKGRYGYIIEAHDPSLKIFKSIVSQKYQTVTYYGVDPNSIANTIRASGLLGVDRIVPVGQALDMGLTWDGLDLISMLSRVLDWN